MGSVVVAMHLHKRSAKTEVMDADETVLGGGRFGTDAAGYAAMKAYAKQWPDRGLGDRGLERQRWSHRRPTARRR